MASIRPTYLLSRDIKRKERGDKMLAWCADFSLGGGDETSRTQKFGSGSNSSRDRALKKFLPPPLTRLLACFIHVNPTISVFAADAQCTLDLTKNLFHCKRYAIMCWQAQVAYDRSLNWVSKKNKKLWIQENDYMDTLSSRQVTLDRAQTLDRAGG